MKEIGSREFQLNYQRLTEPVKVVTRAGVARTIGFFFPGNVPPELGEQTSLFGEPVEKEPPRRDAIEDLL